MTGELISIFEEAKHEALLYLIQKQWDMHLIKAWREHPFLRMSDCASDFEKKIIDVTPGRLKRFPVYKKTHFVLTVSRFIAAFLPKTNNALWDGKTDEEVIVVMGKEQLLAQCADQRKFKHESYVRSSARKNLSATDASIRASKDHNGKCARRNWSAVK
jgi:hypothetical protein